ncbi:dihydroorotase family protein [Virgibacillus byunsanensis]|uniref:Dihydroorotase family protein n=1 Tax=Virgibacillus byunsanensis TaxID=570945 RepID=A0ABW3LQ88_9BACI
MEFFDLILNGKVVLENKIIQGEIGVKDGMIIYISPDKSDNQSKVRMKYDDCYIFPGLIDPHVHSLSNPNEGIKKTTRLAADGGFTTIFDMPFDYNSPITNKRALKEKIKVIEKEAFVDVGLWGTITKYGGYSQIKDLANLGVIGIKMSTFETDESRFPRIPDSGIVRAFREIKEIDLIAAFHAENDEIVKDLINEFKKGDKKYLGAHGETRPPYTETADILKLMEFAYWTDAKIHFVHVSHPRSIDLINYFKRQGLKVTAETCYQYLLLSDDDLKTKGPNAKVNPPLRDRRSRELMWDKLYKGEIDFITTDHAIWDVKNKEKGYKDIFTAPSGMPGLSIVASLVFSEGVLKSKISPIDYGKLMSTNIADVFGIKQKGRIKKGNDADFTIIDPNIEWVIQDELSPFNGKEVRGQVKKTILRGDVIYSNKKKIDNQNSGKYVTKNN